MYGTLLGGACDIDVAFCNRILLFTEEIRQEVQRHRYRVFEVTFRK